MSDKQRPDNLHLYDLWLNSVLGLLTLAVLGAGYFVAIRPMDIQTREIRAEISNLRDLIQQASEISQRNQTLTETLAQSKQATTALAQRIPSSPRESDFLSQISHLAAQTHLEIADYHPGIIDVRENHHEMEVKVTTHGEYEALCRFLKEIDSLPRLCRLAQMDVETQPKENRLQVDLLFRIYFAPPASATAKKG